MKRWIIVLLVSIAAYTAGCSGKQVAETAEQVGGMTEPVVEATMTVKSNIMDYRGFTYGEYREEYGELAEAYHADRFIAPIPDTNLTFEITASEYNEDFVFSLSDDDICNPLQGPLGDMFDGLEREMSLDDFAGIV